MKKSLTGVFPPARTLVAAEDPYADYAVGRQEMFTVRADDGTPLHGHVIYPPELDPEHPDPRVAAVIVLIIPGMPARMGLSKLFMVCFAVE